PGFAGGQVLLPSTWVASTATLVAQASTTPLVVTVRGEEATVEVPSLPGGGVLVVPRPLPAGGMERVEVTERRALTVGEILARHHRQVALQQRVLANFQAWQRLLVRVRVGELDRSVELLLAGPVFYTPELGRDWELREAWVNGAAWPVGALPELPLLQPKAPPVPPLTLELSPTYRYQLLGRQPWGERWVFVLSFFSQGEAPRHWGRAFVDEQTFGLAGLEMFSEHPQGEVRRARSFTRNRLHWSDATPLWLPWQVEGDDLVAAFGGVVTVHRQLTLEQWQINGEAMAERRAQAWRGSNPMLRERRGEVVPLEPDGVGGRREVSAQGRRQSFLLAGGAWDPEVGFPVPLLGYQRLDFAWHGRSQLRLFLAGAVNDLAWSRPGPWEAQVRAFVRLAPSSTAPYLGNRRRDQEAVYLWRQRVRVGLARQWGAVRTAAEVGTDVLHFSRTPDTHPTFRLPRQTLEPVVGVNLTWQRGELLLEGRWEMGQRQRWQTWGFGEPARRRFSRGGLSMRYEHAPVSLVKVSLAADVAFSRNADRFSSYALGGWGGSFAGLPGGRVTTRDYASLRATLGLPWRRERRLELTGQWGWVRHPVTGQGALPLAGVAVGLTARGPWDTMLQASVGLPLVAPGPRQPLAQLLLLRPLGGKPRH
ncbi:MAG: hypothetical protein NZ869_10385, partial [Thermoanaerobaculum sp.]|nr:hypothetical protein [Thermoanaerobaculum sp.]